MIKQIFAKTALFWMVSISLLTACGGGSGGGDRSNNTDSDSDPAVISGSAVKGLIKNGIVTIYGVNAEGVKGAAIAEGLTSESDGSYALKVADYRGPAIVEVTAFGTSEAGYPSLMVCDIPGINSCGSGVSFGEDYVLGQTFSLKAVIPNVQPNAKVTTHVTALTHMAAEYAQSLGVTLSSVNIANSQVANLFGVNGDILKLPVVDISDSASVANINADSQVEKAAALKAAMVSASILAAAAADGSTIEGAVTRVAGNFATNGGQLIQRESPLGSNTTLFEILSAANNLYETELVGIDALKAIATALEADLIAVSSAVEGSLTEAEPNTDNLGDDFQIAKGLIQDLRDISTAASLEDIRNGAMDFSDNLEMARALINDDSGRIFEALSSVAIAIKEAAQAGVSGPEFIASSGLTIEVSIDGEDTVYGFDGVLQIDAEGEAQPVTIALKSQGVYLLQQEQTEEGQSETLSFSVEFGGTLETQEARLEIKEGSRLAFSRTLSGSNEETEQGDTKYHSSDSLDLNLDLNAKLEQLMVAEPVSFSGALLVEVVGYGVEGEFNRSPVTCSSSETGGMFCGSPETSFSNKTEFDRLKLMLNGELTRAAESFKAAIIFNAESNGFELVEKGSWTHFWDQDGDSDWEEDLSKSEETSEAYVDVDFAVDLNLKLAGISDNVAVRLSGDRISRQRADFDLSFHYNGKIIVLDAMLVEQTDWDFLTGQINVVNNTGAVLSCNYVEGGGNPGHDCELKVNGSLQATVDREKGIYLVRYKNSYVESL